MTTPRVGLAIIARDEEHAIPGLLDSVRGAFDRVVLLDTGSTDGTVDTFERWATDESERTSGFTWAVDHFEWCDDFSMARNAADELLLRGNTVAFCCWGDADDIIENAVNLRAIAAQAPPEVSAFHFDYAYTHDQHGNCTCILRRERLVRAGAGHWVGRVHECQAINGGITVIDPSLCRWVHHKAPDSADSGERNLRILHAWNEATPDDPRVLCYLGTEIAIRGQHQDALPYFARYLSLHTTWDEERAQVHRKIAICLLALNRPQDARDTALRALEVLPQWSETYLSLAQCCYALGEHAKAVEWAREALRRGAPDTPLITNPLDFTFAPRLVLAAALGALGQIDEAIDAGRMAVALVPDHPELRQHLSGWEATSQRDSVAQTFAAAARLLVNHDEQLKAKSLLETCVPYFATDHPLVVSTRSWVRERLLWATDPERYDRHYKEGGSKPEDGVTDFVGVCERLPRAQFLIDGLREQEVAA